MLRVYIGLIKLKISFIHFVLNNTTNVVYMNNKENQQIMSNTKSEQTTASILMKSAGSTVNVTGYTLSSVSTLYFIKYLSTLGCSTIEFLPQLLANKTTSFVEWTKGRELGNIYAYATLISFLGVGIGLRKLGTMLSDEKSIDFVERMLYGKSKEM
jgi:ABC-type dipeptide/oligopeptide/nickel transport system permease subunit